MKFISQSHTGEKYEYTFQVVGSDEIRIVEQYLKVNYEEVRNFCSDVYSYSANGIRTMKTTDGVTLESILSLNDEEIYPFGSTQ